MIYEAPMIYDLHSIKRKPPNALAKATKTLKRAQLAQAKAQKQLTALLAPIMLALGIPSVRRVTSIKTLNRRVCRVSYEWDAGRYIATADALVPLSVLRSADPIEAARHYARGVQQ